MRKDIKVDFIAPPFMGHVMPLLQLARVLKDNGGQSVSFLSTPRAKPWIEREGVEFAPLVADQEAGILEMIESTKPTGVRYVASLVQRTLVMMSQFRDELRTRWIASPPDLVVVDCMSPLAGIIADELSLRWWTATIIPCWIETKTGTPCLNGGWMPPKSFLGRARDGIGRSTIRITKRLVFSLFRRHMKALGVESVYRANGEERVISPERILALGVPDFEFPRDWPSQLVWAGPCIGLSHSRVEPHFEPGRSHVLITMGTQLGPLACKMESVIRVVAAACPLT
ncbi:MAG: hypothetical protein ACRC46_12980 [Thermoguttaceae bacterium]